MSVAALFFKVLQLVNRNRVCHNLRKLIQTYIIYIDTMHSTVRLP